MAIKQFVLDSIKSHSSSVKFLNLANAGLRDIDAADIVKLINENENITKVDFSQNNFSDRSANFFVNLSNVFSINLSKTHYKDAGVIELINNNNFHSIDFSNNRSVTDTAGQVILISASQIYLNLDGTKISKPILDQINARINSNLKTYNIYVKNRSNNKFFDNDNLTKNLSHDVDDEKVPRNGM